MGDLEIQGAWKMLCASLMYDALAVLASGRKAEDRKVIRDWIDAGNVGEVTFFDCCESLRYDPDILRQKIESIRGKPIRKPYSRVNLRVRETSDCHC